MMVKWLFVVLVALPGGAAAQDDPMELQRCIWRCLADSPGAASAEYHQCVAARCSDTDAAPPPPRAAAPPVAPLGPAWSTGVTQDGRGFFAGQNAPETGNLLYYTCDTSGTQNLLLSGEVEGPAAVISLDIDGQVLGLWFDPTPGGFTARLEPGSPVPALITGAHRLELRNSSGWSLGQFGMAGAREAIRAAQAACGL